jgi:thiamine pyrophosphate-dependent acetolactate synthase large subunit-like protein
MRPETRPAPAGVQAAVDALAGAANPLILAGSGVLLSDCQAEIEEMAALSGAWLATSLRANRMFEGHSSDLGLAGGWSPPPVRNRLAAADVVLAVGTSLNDFVTAGGTAFPHATVIHCEIDPDHRYATTVPEIVLHGDARETVRALTAEWRARNLPARRSPTAGLDADAIRAAARAIDLGHDPARGLDPREVFIAFDEKLPKDRVVVTDTGRFLGTLPSLIGSLDARSWLVGNSFQSVGQGLGAAIGAAAAYPHRAVVLFTGDGGFTMSAQDLEAVRMNDLHLSVVVINDQQYGSEMHHLEQFDLPMDVIRQPIPDVTILARAFGGTGTVIATESQLAEFEFTRGGLQLIDVRVDPQVNVREVPNAWSRQAKAGGSTLAAQRAF